METLTLKFPKGTSEEEGKALEAEIKQIAGVGAAGVKTTRGIGGDLSLWFSFLPALLNTPMLGNAVDLVTKIVDLIKGKGLGHVEIQLPNNGGTLKVDSASRADIEKLLKAVREASQQ
jgi:hypothetical protein